MYKLERRRERGTNLPWMAHEHLIQRNIELIITNKGVVGQVFAAMCLREGQLSLKLRILGKVLVQQGFIYLDVVWIGLENLNATSCRAESAARGRFLSRSCLEILSKVRGDQSIE